MKWMRYTAVLLLALAVLVPAVYADEPERVFPETAQAAETENQSSAAPDAWKLLLVNPWTPLPEDFTVELEQMPNGMRVDSRIREDLEAMLSDCREAGLRPLICSAYRTQATQTRLYNNKIARLRAAGYSRESALTEAGRWVAVPGTSEHQTGMALDIVSAGYQVLNRRQESTAEQKWLMEHCWEYGFILRYPAEKCDITGIGYEPWHYRYVGREDALAMRDSGLCLEEYLQAMEAAQAAEPESKTVLDAKAMPETEKILPVAGELDEM